MYDLFNQHSYVYIVWTWLVDMVLVVVVDAGVDVVLMVVLAKVEGIGSAINEKYNKVQ